MYIYINFDSKLRKNANFKSQRKEISKFLQVITEKNTNFVKRSQMKFIIVPKGDTLPIYCNLSGNLLQISEIILFIFNYTC